MKRYQASSSMLLVGILALCLPVVARADSSWVWISETRPYDVLPFVVVGTLLIETLGIWLIPRVKKPLKVFCVTCLGNVLSFAVPYVLCLFNPVYDFAQVMESHFYTVGVVFLVVTIAIEVPIEYYLLRKETDRPKALLCAVILCNVITTVAVAAVERTLCYGWWV